jgi:hypothetical protein
MSSEESWAVAYSTTCTSEPNGPALVSGRRAASWDARWAYAAAGLAWLILRPAVLLHEQDRATQDRIGQI